MVNSFDELKEKIEYIYSLIPSFDIDERKEIKKNNKIINDYILELNEYNKIILDTIRDKKEKMVPSYNENVFDDLDLKVAEKLDVVKFLSDNSFITKLYMDKNLYEIRYSVSLDKINENISDLINKFLLIDIKLTSNDFKYSLSLYKYMCFYFDNKDNSEFDKLAVNFIDSLYWECPNIIYHIYLSFVLLLDKYSDKFELYIKKSNEDRNYEDEINRYFELRKEIDDKKNLDKSFIYYKFINNDYRIEEYLSDSIFRKEVISKYVDYDKYKDYSVGEKDYFYSQINGMYLDFCEYLDISKYQFLIDKAKEVYSSKGNNSGNYASIRKNIKALNKQRDKLNSKLFKIKDKKSGLLFKKYKYNSLFNKVNAKINEIIDIYNNYDYDCFVNDLVTKLNDDSNCYDVFKVYENNYGYLVKLLDENGCNYQEFIQFLYSPNLTICKSLFFMNELDIKNKLVNKYDLFDMNFNISDENRLYEELSYIMRLWYFDRANIEMDTIKLIIDINKIKKEEI